jgi:hypothetical protein
MSVSPVYVLDSNVLIEATNRYYAFDIAPSFWRQLLNLAEQGSVISIDKVKKELIRGTDELADWAKNEFSSAFVSTDDQDVLARYIAMITWSQGHAQFNDTAKAEFAGTDNADPWVMSFAQAKGYLVVSEETLKRDIKRRIPIPNACEELGIPYTNTFEMLRSLKVKL